MLLDHEGIGLAYDRICVDVAWSRVAKLIP